MHAVSTPSAWATGGVSGFVSVVSFCFVFRIMYFLSTPINFFDLYFFSHYFLSFFFPLKIRFNFYLYGRRWLQ